MSTISSKYHEYSFCMWLSWLLIKLSTNPPLFVLIDMLCNRYGGRQATQLCAPFIPCLYLPLSEWNKIYIMLCYVMLVFKKGNSRVNYNWYYNGTQLTVTNRIPYLGLLFSSNGSFHQAQLTLAGQANKAVYMLCRKLSKFSNLKPDFMLDLFDKFIAPILNYGCEVWGFHPAPNIELIALRFYKNILGVKKSTQNDFVYGELGRTPMIVIRHMRIIKYWLNIVMGNKSPYVAGLYHFFMRQVDINNKPSWVRSVKTLLSRKGFGDVWVNQGVEDIDIFMNIFKQRLIDTFRQEWHGRLQESSRARFYRVVKPQHQLSKYLQCVTYKPHRMALSRFIMSSHCLCVETGRWRRPDPIPYERRYCASCRNKIEDEYHMLFECELYDELRNTLIPRYFRTRPSMFKLIEFINSASNKQIRGLAKFVYNAFKIRSNLVWPTGNHSICAYTFELFMLLLTFCSCFVWFHALVTDLLPCWPCVFLSYLYISRLYGPVASKAIQ